MTAARWIGALSWTTATRRRALARSRRARRRSRAGVDRLAAPGRRARRDPAGGPRAARGPGAHSRALRGQAGAVDRAHRRRSRGAGAQRGPTASRRRWSPSRSVRTIDGFDALETFAPSATTQRDPPRRARRPRSARAPPDARSRAARGGLLHRRVRRGARRALRPPRARDDGQPGRRAVLAFREAPRARRRGHAGRDVRAP